MRNEKGLFNGIVVYQLDRFARNRYDSAIYKANKDYPKDISMTYFGQKISYEDLFSKIKEDISYEGEYSVAYGFHPAVLSYNGISTLDACLSHYSQAYKEDFREIIAPALEKSEAARIYYDEWAGRAYIFSGTDESVWNPQKTMNVTDYELSINPEAFKNMKGVYIFSRIEICNADNLDLKLINSYTDENPPYTIWVYSNR